MEQLKKVFTQTLNIDLIDIILSNPKQKDVVSKIKIRPILLKGTLLYQVSEYKGKKIYHKNLEFEEIINNIESWFTDYFKQAQIITKDKHINIIISKKGKTTINVKKTDKNNKNQNLSHNREKQYILKEGKPITFLIDLGVMTKEGKVIKAKYDKFKQINRFLEFIEDILPSLDKEKELTIIDFGCGKSYLTFAMYYYLKEINNYNINVIGLDLKEDVIKYCTELKEKYGFEQLNFKQGSIAQFDEVKQVDMVVSLHACDTATDYALAKAVKWGASVIFSVPCCQHEINSQIDCDILEPVLKYGLIKERISALITDGIRAELLEREGYKAQILEFIDITHTPKNILIRAVKNNTIAKNQTLDDDKFIKSKKLDEFKGFINVKPILEELLNNSKE